MILTAKNKASMAVHMAQEKKGVNIKVIEIGKVSLIADYFIILSGSSERHAQALAAFILLEFKKKEIAPLTQVGQKEGRWILLDFGDVVVHIFQEEERKFYNLERLWAHASEVSLEVGSKKWEEE